MPAIDSLTTPLAILFDDGSKQLAVHGFRHPLGLLYLTPFWHQQTPEQGAHLIRGDLCGDGPWRIADATIRVLGCAHTDPELQADFQRWNSYLEQHPGDYPPAEQVRQIARRLGALIGPRQEPDSA